MTTILTVIVLFVLMPPAFYAAVQRLQEARDRAQATTDEKARRHAMRRTDLGFAALVGVPIALIGHLVFGMLVPSIARVMPSMAIGLVLVVPILAYVTMQTFQGWLRREAEGNTALPIRPTSWSLYRRHLMACTIALMLLGGFPSALHDISAPGWSYPAILWICSFGLFAGVFSNLRTIAK